VHTRTEIAKEKCEWDENKAIVLEIGNQMAKNIVLAGNFYAKFAAAKTQSSRT
jgi:hypothetical protein